MKENQGFHDLCLLVSPFEEDFGFKPVSFQ
jgi:hypothetical protein